jgi:hypothetical protein
MIHDQFQISKKQKVVVFKWSSLARNRATAYTCYFPQTKNTGKQSFLNGSQTQRDELWWNNNP